MRSIRFLRQASGFTMVELAISIFVVAILLSGLLVPLTTQVTQRKTGDAQKALEDVKEALYGYAMSRGRLPCPATAASNGIESPVNGGACTTAYGFVPAVTLGLSGTDAQGYAIDTWGTRIRYAVTTSNANAFTTTNGMRTAGMGALLPDLYVCATATGITATTCGTATMLVGSAPAVIHSLGPNWATGGGGADEAANLNNDPIFVFHLRTAAGANGEFDDIVTWLSTNALTSRMVMAGQLP
ncbi:MAG: type II secretion system protein [Burkholderiales bacterium]